MGICKINMPRDMPVLGKYASKTWSPTSRLEAMGTSSTSTSLQYAIHFRFETKILVFVLAQSILLGSWVWPYFPQHSSLCFLMDIKICKHSRDTEANPCCFPIFLIPHLQPLFTIIAIDIYPEFIYELCWPWFAANVKDLSRVNSQFFPGSCCHFGLTIPNDNMFALICR
jgi:hypothetical protein